MENTMWIINPLPRTTLFETCPHCGGSGRVAHPVAPSVRPVAPGIRRPVLTAVTVDCGDCAGSGLRQVNSI